MSCFAASSAGKTSTNRSPRVNHDEGRASRLYAVFVPGDGASVGASERGCWQYVVLFHLAGFTGLRSGELCGLHVEDVKLEHGVIEVRRSVWNGLEGETKTRAGKRNVFIDSVTVRLLRNFLAGRQTGRVFQSQAGTPLENRDICRRVLTPICERLGIVPGGMHAFRHGRVSHMQSSMVPGDFVMSQVGHSSLRVTSNYTHFEHNKKREMAERLLSCTQNGSLYSIAN